MVDDDKRLRLKALTPIQVRQIDEKSAEAMDCGFATVELVFEKGRLRWIRGPAPSVPAERE